MSSDDPSGRYDETADGPATPRPPNGQDGEATTPLGQRQAPAAPSHPETRIAPSSEPLRHAGPPQPPRRPSGPTVVGPAAGPPPGAGPGWQPQPGYSPPQGFPPPQGFQPPQGYPAQQNYPAQQGYPAQQNYGAPPPIYPQAPRRNNKWYLIGGGVAVVVVVAVVAAVLLRGGDDATSTATSTSALSTASATSSAPSTTTSATPTPANVDPARIPQLLLTPDAISTTMGTPGMVPQDVQRGPEIATTDSVVDPLECASAWAPGKSWPYTNSGNLAIARQTVSEQPTPTHAVIQAVVVFPDDIAARKSYNTQVKAWMGCQGKTIGAHLNAATQDQTAVVGTATENGDVATLQTTPNIPGLPGVVCQRVLTPVANVVVDVRACSPNVGDAGVTVARDIAAKITGG